MGWAKGDSFDLGYDSCYLIMDVTNLMVIWTKGYSLIGDMTREARCLDDILINGELR